MSRRGPTDFEIVPIKRLDLYQVVLERIRALVVGLQPGDQLPSERDLAERLGVSRVSVRQALKVLESMGLIDTRVGSGTFVRDQSDTTVVNHFLGTERVDARFLKELAALRAAIDTRIFAAAAERWTPADSERLRVFLEHAGQEIAGGEDDEPGSLDLRFEAMVGEVAGNRLLSRFQRIVHEMWVRAWAEQGIMPDLKLKLHEEHLQILAAIQAGEWERVTAMVQAHIDRGVAPGAVGLEAPPGTGGGEKPRG